MPDLEHQLSQWGAARKSCPAPNLLVAVSEDVLPIEAAQAVRQHLEQCPVCRQLEADLRAECLEPSLADVLRTGKRLQPAPRRSRWVGALPYAAAVVIALGSFVALRDRGTTPVPGPGPRPTPAPKETVYRIAFDRLPLKLGLENAVVWRGEAASPQQTYLLALKNALEPYFRSEYEDAATRLEELTAAYPKAAEPRFYLGVALLLKGDAAAAVAPFETLRKQPPAHLASDLTWYLAAAYERAGKPDQAKALIGEICHHPGAYQQRACALGSR